MAWGAWVEYPLKQSDNCEVVKVPEVLFQWTQQKYLPQESVEERFTSWEGFTYEDNQQRADALELWIFAFLSVPGDIPT